MSNDKIVTIKITIADCKKVSLAVNEFVDILNESHKIMHKISSQNDVKMKKVIEDYKKLGLIFTKAHKKLPRVQG